MKNYLVYLAYLLLFSSCFNNTSIPSSSLSENSITPSNHSLSTHSEYQSNDNNSLADISAYYTVCSENEMIALNKLENQIIQETKEIVNEDSMEEELQIEQKVNLK